MDHVIKNLNEYIHRLLPSKTIAYDNKDYPWLKGGTKNLFKKKES